ncbi:Aspm, partial [Symbiodinium sp. KB8]
GHEQLGQLLAECQQEAQVAAQGAAGSPTAPFQPLSFQPPAGQEAASPSPAKRLRPTVEDWEDVWSGDLDVDFADDVAIPLATETDEATPSRRPPPLPAAAEPALPDPEQDMAALRQEWKDKLSKVSALQVGQAPATREASLGLLQQLRRLPMPAQVSGLPDIPESTGTPLQALDQANMLLSVLGEGTLAERVSMHLALAPSLPSVVTASSAAPSLHYQDSDTGSHRPQRSPFMSFDPDAVQPPPLGGAGQSLGSVGDGVESLGGMSSCSGQASVGFDDARLGVTNADVLSVISGGALASEGGAGRHAPPTPLSDGRRLPPAREGMSHADAVKMYHCMSPEEQEAVDGEVARIQRNVRAWLVLRNYRNIRGAITSLQAYTRCALARKKFAAAKQATVAVQSQWRGRQARDALRQAQAALVIQRGLPAGAEGGGRRSFSMAVRKHVSVPPGLARLQEVAGGDQAAHARLGKVDVVARLVGWAPASPPQLPLPQEARGARCLAVMQDRQTVIIEDPSAGQSVPIAVAQKRMRFDLAVPDTASNAELNETLARVVVDDWLQHGFDVSVLAMGTTGTGKSVSMLGSAAFGTGTVAREAGFPGLVQTCVSRLLGGAASPADYMLSLAVAEVRPEGEGDLPNLPLTSVLVHDAEEVQAALEAGQQRSVSWEQAAASKTTLVPKPGASHVLVRLGVLHVPSGTLAHLGVLDTAGWPETRTPTAHDSPSAHNQVNGKDGYHLRSWLRALGGASRGGEQQQDEQGRPLRGAALHGRATALPETRQSQLNALVSLMVLGNAKAFLLGFTSISEQSYFSALRTLQVLRGVSSVKLPLLPSHNATAESLGQVVSLGSVLPPPSAARDCAAAQPAPRREQLTSTSRHGESKAKTVDEAAAGSEEGA